MRRLHAGHIEIAVARSFNPRLNIIVPNVWWGWGLNYEADLVIITSSGYATEVEIKTSKSDIKAERKKTYTAHHSNRIKRFFYAVPWYLQDCEDLRLDCGLLVVDENLRCRTVRSPKINHGAHRLSDKEIRKLLHLGCMRIWDLKERINSYHKP